MPKFNFEKYWQKLIGEINENPPESVWDNIQDELDIDEVWTQIDQNIPAPVSYWQSGFRFLLKLSAVLLLLLLPRDISETNNFADSLSYNNTPTAALPLIDSQESSIEETTAFKRGEELTDVEEEKKVPTKETSSIKDSSFSAENILEEDIASENATAIDKTKTASENSQSLAKAIDAAAPKKQIDASQFNANNKSYVVNEPANFVNAKLPEVVNEAFKNKETDLISNDSSLARDNMLADSKKLLQKRKELDVDPNVTESNSTLNIDSENLGLIKVAHPDQGAESRSGYKKLAYIKPSFELKETGLTNSIKRINQSEDLEEKNPASPALQFLSLGVNGTIKNSRLLNNDTRAANSGNSLSTTRLTFTTDFGASIQWKTPKNQMLQVSYFFISESAQTYNQYIEARYGQRKLQVNYQTLSMEFVQPVRFTKAYIIAGPYLSSIQSVEESVNGVLKDFTNDYQNWEYGINIGIQYISMLSNKISIQPSIKLQYGLNNIFRGNNLTPANFNNTNPINLSFGLGIYYHISK